MIGERERDGFADCGGVDIVDFDPIVNRSPARMETVSTTILHSSNVVLT